MTHPRRVALLAGAALLLAAPGLASAQEREAPPPVSAYRVALMEGLRAHTGAMRAVLDGGAPFHTALATNATAVRDIALMVAQAFPGGTGGEGTRAKDEIWQNAAGFQERMDALVTAAGALHDAAASGDDAATGEALQGVGQTCAGCHREFRAPAN